jgi:vacuole morphology and inheritance protein 14
VAWTSILQHINQTFEGLCKLFANMNLDVKNSATLLDCLIKDIVTKSDTNNKRSIRRSQIF